MKWWALLIGELLLLGGALGFVAFGARALGGGRADAWEASGPRHAEDGDPRVSPFATPARVPLTTTPAGTFTGIKDELLLAPLRTQTVRDVRFNHGGSSVSLRVTFSDGSRAAFKPLQNNPQTVPRKEIAAYWINRLLGLNSVPPAAARTLHRDDIFNKLNPESKSYLPRLNRETIFDSEGFTRGEVSYWIPVIVNSRLDDPQSIEQWTRWLSVGQEIPRNKLALMAQLSSVLVFDLVQNNSDRFSGGNLQTSPDGKILYFMDNTFGFQVQEEGHEKCRIALGRCQKFSRRLVAALRGFDGHALRQALESDPGVLSDAEIAAVVARKDVALGYIDSLIDRYGSERVLVFP